MRLMPVTSDLATFSLSFLECYNAPFTTSLTPAWPWRVWQTGGPQQGAARAGGGLAPEDPHALPAARPPDRRADGRTPDLRASHQPQHQAGDHLRLRGRQHPHQQVWSGQWAACKTFIQRWMLQEAFFIIINSLLFFCSWSIQGCRSHTEIYIDYYYYCVSIFHLDSHHVHILCLGCIGCANFNWPANMLSMLC